MQIMKGQGFMKKSRQLAVRMAAALINPPFPTGAITQSKSFNVPAPSSLAASKSSSGIPLKICVRNTVPKGRNAIGRISASHVSKSFS